MNCISYFFTGDKPYSITRTLLIKEYKVGRVPPFRGAMVHSVKLLTRSYPCKMFYTTNNLSLVCYTANLLRPLALLAEITFLPFFVFILVLKPCVLFLGVLWG